MIDMKHFRRCLSLFHIRNKFLICSTGTGQILTFIALASDIYHPA